MGMICESNHLLMGGGCCIYLIHPGLLDLSLISFFSSGFARAGISARPGRTGRPRYPEFSWDVVQYYLDWHEAK